MANRFRNKDPRGGWRVGKSYKHDTNKVIRAQSVEQPEALPHKKKSTGKKLKWCGGHVGRVHILTAEHRRLYGILDAWVLTCTRCHKDIETWYPSYWMRLDARQRPIWLPDEAPGGKRDA